jgi:hypothetical protein
VASGFADVLAYLRFDDLLASQINNGREPLGEKARGQLLAPSATTWDAHGISGAEGRPAVPNLVTQYIAPQRAAMPGWICVVTLVPRRVGLRLAEREALFLHVDARPLAAGIAGAEGWISTDSFRSRPALSYAGIRARPVAASSLTVWRRVSHRAPRYGPPACAGKGRRRHGSDERPCMQRRFPAASCRLPAQGPGR